MYALRLTIDNLRSFDHAVIELNRPGEPCGASVEFDNVNLLLGDNGSGKTTLLGALALAALAPVMPGSGWVPYCMVRRLAGRQPLAAKAEVDLALHAQDGGAQEANLRLALWPTPGFVDRLSPAPDTPPWTEPMWDDQSAAFLVLGYGAGRRVESRSGGPDESRHKTRALRYDRVAGLFDEAATLVHLAAWWPHLRTSQPERYDDVRALLNRLLPQGELLADASEDEPLFRLFGSDLPLRALSDGYRAYIGWVADLLFHLHRSTPAGATLDATRGIVLVDEVDLHLHPAWQRRVIPTLARALPRLQFVLTSHSPLVVGTLRRENVFVLESRADTVADAHATHVQPARGEAWGLSADQILTSGHFGLDSARNDDFVRRLREQAHQARTGDPEAALAFMRSWALGGAEEDDREERLRERADGERFHEL